MARRALLLVPAFLAGCNFAPAYQAPPTGVPEQFPVVSEKGVRVESVTWEVFFRDPALRELIGKALAHNRDLGAAVSRIEQARARFHVQRSQRLPELELAGGVQRGRLSGAGAVAQNQAVEVAIPGFELDFWGRVANLSESARLQYLATVEAQRTFRLSLIANVAASYFAMRAGEEGIVLAQKSLDSRRETLELAQLRMEAGFTSTIDYHQAYVLVTQAETQLAQLKRSREQAFHLLQSLVGLPLGDPQPSGLPIEDASQLARIDAGLPSDLLNNRPDIRMAEQTLRAANANIGVARALYFPTIALTASSGYASSELSGLVTDRQRAWSFGTGSALPLLDWGRRKAQVDVARGERDEREMVYQSTVQKAFREVADGLSASRRNVEQIEAQQRAVEVQAALVDTAQHRYDVGLSTYLEVLDAERSHFSAEQTLLQLQATALQDRVNLYVALGGGD